ncbi:MAG: hypothetical protein ACERKU_09180, partial [Nitrospirota bacterium]
AGRAAEGCAWQQCETERGKIPGAGRAAEGCFWQQWGAERGKTIEAYTQTGQEGKDLGISTTTVSALARFFIWRGNRVLSPPLSTQQKKVYPSGAACFYLDSSFGSWRCALATPGYQSPRNTRLLANVVFFYTPSVAYSLKFNSNQLLAWRA